MDMVDDRLKSSPLDQQQNNVVVGDQKNSQNKSSAGIQKKDRSSIKDMVFLNLNE